MFRLLGVLISVLFAIGTVVVAWPQFFGVEQLFPIAQLVAVRGALIAGYAGLAVLMLFVLFARPLRGFAASILIISLLGGLAHGGVLYLRGVDGALPERSEGSIRIMTWNTNGEAVSAAEIADAIVEHDADVVALPETANSVGREIALLLRDRDHRMWVHHVDFYPDVPRAPQAWQTTVLISPRLGDYSVIESSRNRSSNTGQVPSAVLMPVSGTGPTIVAVHAVAPRPGAMEQWRADLRWIADQCPAGQNVILAGDFNATIDHTASLGIGDGDVGACTDAAGQTGTGGMATWPAALPWLIGAPIDRVLATDHWVAEGSLVFGDDRGSDHRAIVVQLAPAG